MFWSDSKQLKSTTKPHILMNICSQKRTTSNFSPTFRVGPSTGPRLFGLLELQQWHVSLEKLLALVSSPLWLLTHPWKLVPWRCIHRLDEWELVVFWGSTW